MPEKPPGRYLKSVKLRQEIQEMNSSGKSAKESVRELLHLCQAARGAGKDFPTIWSEIIKGHPAVAGIPAQSTMENGSALEIQLLTGQKLIFGHSAFSLWP